MAHSPLRRIAFLAYERLTLLDLVGPYDALRRVATMGIDAELQHAIIGIGPRSESGLVPDGSGFAFRVDAHEASLDGFDLLVVPGGPGTRALMADEKVIAYLRGWGQARPIASVCTGSLLLGAAGHLEGLAATTHASHFEDLRPFVRELRDERVVDEGRVITAGGVCAGIDLGLHLVDRFWGSDARARIARQMNYAGASARAADETEVLNTVPGTEVLNTVPGGGE